MEDMDPALEAEMNEWIVGEVILKHHSTDLDAWIVVVKDGEYWSMIRGFMMGSHPAVSLDVSEKTYVDVIKRMAQFI